MTKFNKLLSIFVIAGAVATGTAALVGCDGHIHSATKHEAVAATCTHAGTKEYYTCSGSECEGKYFSDETCTTEVTLESLTIAATGHTAVEHAATAATCTHTGNSLYYTCSGSECDGKYYTDAACTTETTLAAVTIAATGHTATLHEEHAATCTQAGNSAYYTCSGSECEGKYYTDAACTTETTLANTVIPALGHKDDNNDFRCDNNCGTNVFKAGHYYGVGYANMEIEVEENGTVWYKDDEYHIALSAEGVATLTLNVSSSGSSTPHEVTYTVTKTAEGYKAVAADETIYFIKKPEDLGVERAGFKGVFEGEYTYTVRGDGTYKITKLAIADGKVQRTQVKIMDENGDAITNSQPITDLLTDGAVTDKYNEFKAENFYFIATEVEDGTYGGQSIKYVTKLKVTYDGAVLAEFNKTTESVKAVPTSLPLDDYTYYEDEDEIGMRLLATASGTNKSYKIGNAPLTIVNGDDTTKEYLIYYYDNSAGGTRCNITLKISEDRNTIEVTQADNQTITLTKRTQTFRDLKVDGNTENNSAVVDIFNEEYAYYKVGAAGWYTFTARSTDVKLYTEVDNHLVTSSGSTVLNISSGARRTVQLEAGAYIAVDRSAANIAFTATYSETEPEPDYILVADGKAEITSFKGADVYFVKGTAGAADKYYVSVSNTVYDDKGPYFIVNDTKYGYTYDSNSWKYSLLKTGEVAEVTLEAGATLIIKVGSDNSYLNLTKVIVTFETEKDYNARLAAETTSPVYSGDQLGDYKCNSDTYTVAANDIKLNGTALTFVKQKNGNYYYTKGTTSYTISFVEGKLSVKTGGNEYTAIKPVAVTFTEAQQGTYVYSYERWGRTYTITYTVGADSVSVNSNNASGELICVGYDAATGVYTYQKGNSTMSFSFNAAGNMAVATDDINWMDDYYVAEK